MVELEKLSDPEEIAQVFKLITQQKEYTNSKRATEILANWKVEVEKFVKVMPTDYKKALLKLKEEAANNVSAKEARHG